MLLSAAGCVNFVFAVADGAVFIAFQKSLYNSAKFWVVDMGRVKTDMVKRTTRKIVAMYPEKFSKTFDKNKLELKDVAEFGSKKMRNVIAGYVSRLKRKSEQAPRPRKREETREMRPMRPRPNRY